MNCNENVSKRISSNVMDNNLYNSNKKLNDDEFSYSSIGEYHDFLQRDNKTATRPEI